MNYTMETIEAWLDRFTEVIEQNKQVLSDLDTPIGDGDHGNNMARGVKAYQDAKEKKHLNPLLMSLKLWRWP